MNETPVPRDIPLPLPAPEPVLIAVLVIFFLMHIVFVNFMVGGALLTFWYQLRGLKEKRFDDLAYAVASTITANKSIAVVLGVGPLLAINTIYTVYFYTANALTGAFWIGIIPLVIVAFVLTYIHKYLWRQMEQVKWLHIGIMAIVCLLFLFIPLIFLTNINLTLFPEKWGTVQGFLSALALPNVFPRYAHFLLACPAMTGLFLVWLFRRRSDEEIAQTGFGRAELIRKGYQWAFWPTAAQFLVGPAVLLTLPRVQEPSHAMSAVFGVAILFSLGMAHLMFTETRRPAETIGKRFVPICMLMLVVVSLMGTGRHLYREAAIAPHRELVRAKTADYMRKVEEANREAAAASSAQGTSQ
ncbi:cytochrome C [Ensifer aridi]|uniref:cytochrome C n=1 Tax=Ensifer aridi TaxID=1708715 RepID=UPI00111C8A2A|nr:cytochrome C [Ensifer aridi]